MGSCGHCRGLDSQESRDRKKPGCGSRVFSARHSTGDPASCLFYLLLTLWGLLIGSSRGSLRAPCSAWTHLSFSKRCRWAARGHGKVHLEKEHSPAVRAEGRKLVCLRPVGKGPASSSKNHSGQTSAVEYKSWACAFGHLFNVSKSSSIGKKKEKVSQGWF